MDASISYHVSQISQHFQDYPPFPFFVTPHLHLISHSLLVWRQEDGYKSNHHSLRNMF